LDAGVCPGEGVRRCSTEEHLCSEGAGGRNRVNLQKYMVQSLATGNMGASSHLVLTPSFFHIFIYRKKRNWGHSVPYGYKFCPLVVPAVVSNIIYTLLPSAYLLQKYEGTEIVQGHLETYIIVNGPSFMIAL
jgi:hypothetical protein